MTNPCERTDSLLSAFIEDEASPAEHRFVDGHLAACGRCRKEHRAMTRLLHQLKLAPQVNVSEGFTERVLDDALGRSASGLDEPLVPSRPSPARTWTPAMAMAAALAFAVYLGATNLPRLFQDQAPPVAVTSPEETDAPEELVTNIPESRSLADKDPSLMAIETEKPALGVGMASEEYVLEDWVLNRPTGGGDPVLTRVSSAGTKDRIVVTY